MNLTGDNYLEVFVEHFKEGYMAAIDDDIEGTDNPYDFIEENYQYSAWKNGYNWYWMMVH